MRKVIIQILTALVVFICITRVSYPQSIEETLSNISSGAVLKYAEPVIYAFGSSMNSGWFTGLPSSTNGIHAKLRAVGIGSFFSNNMRTFSYTGVLRFTSQQVDEILNASGINTGSIPNYEEIKNEVLSRDWEVNFNGPTITGKKNDHLVIKFPGAVISGQNINSYAIELEDVRGYLDNIDLLPSPALQFDVGSVLGTGVSVRYFRGINLYDLGIVGVWGAGFTHNLNYWFEEPLPIEIGFGYYFQDFRVGDVFQNTASQFGMFMSKKLGGRISIEPYASLTYETSRSQIDYKYHFDSPIGRQELQLNIDYKGDSTVNLAVGTSINLSLFMINFDYKFGGTNTGTVGIGFGF